MLRKRFVRFLLLGASLLTAARLDAQEPDPPFACRPGAVDIIIDEAPSIAFVPLAQRPPLAIEAREFTFTTGPFRHVRVYQAGTVAAGPLGLSSEALLSLYVETAVSTEDASARRTKWWELRSAAYPLTFDANHLRACFEGTAEDECRFADVSLAADASLPMIVVSFGRDLGGANASNWSDTQLLLDFRAAEPRVALTAECGYNEGGGACTAIDSSMSPRFTLSCPWNREAGDFLCTEERDTPPSHREFYLLSGRTAPPRAGESASLEQAIRVLAGRRIGDTEIVNGLGQVRWIDEVEIDASTRAMILATHDSFFVAARTGAGFGPILTAKPRALIESRTTGREEEADDGWTVDRVARFDARAIARQRHLAVVEIVEYGDEPETGPVARYWLGLDTGSPQWSADAAILASNGAYDACGAWLIPHEVVSEGAIAEPFAVPVVIQPPTRVGGSEPIAWAAAYDDPEVVECRRRGTIAWKAGRFDTTIDTAPCKAAEKPQEVLIVPRRRGR